MNKTPKLFAEKRAEKRIDDIQEAYSGDKPTYISSGYRSVCLHRFSRVRFVRALVGEQTCVCFGFTAGATVEHDQVVLRTLRRACRCCCFACALATTGMVQDTFVSAKVQLAGQSCEEVEVPLSDGESKVQ